MKFNYDSPQNKPALTPTPPIPGAEAESAKTSTQEPLEALVQAVENQSGQSQVIEAQVVEPAAGTPIETVNNDLAILDEDPFAETKGNAYSYRPAVDVARQVAPVKEMEAMASYKQQLAARPEVRALTDELDINNPNTIEQFGQKAGLGISKISDTLLANTQAVTSAEVSEMMDQLTNVIKKFDAAELDPEPEKKGWFGKLKAMTRESLEAMLNKYDTLGKDVDRISAILTKYLGQIDQSNANLLRMYDANAKYYKALEYYVVAADLALQEIEEERKRIEADTTIDAPQKTFELKKLEDASHRLIQRKADLQTAETVALQMQPTLAIMMNSNYQLMGKINTSFIITLPIFKISLANAVMLKRQNIQARSIAQLDEATNELLKRNASNMMSQSKEIARMANTTSIKVETLEQIQQAILNGVNETNEMVRQASEKLKSDSDRIDVMVNELRAKGFGW